MTIFEPHLSQWKFWIAAGVALAIGLAGSGGAESSDFPYSPPLSATIVSPVLSGWQAPETIADYRDQIQETPFGYLRWQRFPVRVAIEPAAATVGDAGAERDRQWVAAVRRAIADWQPYFPLVEVAAEDRPSDRSDKNLDNNNEWDIYIHRSRPPLQRLRDGTILPARLADTRYEMLSSPPTTGSSPIQFRFRIRMGHQQGQEGLQSTARHELGHALGLWGHSTNPQDVMYPAQTGDYPPISEGDLKTLQWLYN